ncbi:hypothetical protein CRG98_034532 [Punica granatum]|uniref:Uncharacterized protein n=1 Tax=Punica granatum TaxID=22663 RepID=A0A2I0IN09_PUNGR|nr:hypothetical protein CRG98_034532 [Punica granatum]
MPGQGLLLPATRSAAAVGLGPAGKVSSGSGFRSSLPLRFPEAMESPVLRILWVLEELGCLSSRITKAPLLLVSTMTFCLGSHRRHLMMESRSELQERSCYLFCRYSNRPSLVVGLGLLGLVTYSWPDRPA